MNPHARLVALAADLRMGALDVQKREELAEAIERIALGEDARSALGLKRGPGQRAWTTCAGLAKRDRLLRDAAPFFPSVSFAAQARRLHEELVRYYASAWRRERTLDQCPERHLGTVQELFWRILKAHDHVPAARSLRHILAGS